MGVALAAVGVVHAEDAPAAASAVADDPAAHVSFVEEPGANCVIRGALQLLVRNTDASRPLRVWLERTQMGQGTGDRSRSDLAPGAEAEPLGCNRVLGGGEQRWRIVKAIWLP